jgi:hypothetical protein
LERFFLFFKRRTTCIDSFTLPDQLVSHTIFLKKKRINSNLFLPESPNHCRKQDLKQPLQYPSSLFRQSRRRHKQNIPGHKKYTPNIRYKKSTSVYSQKYPRGTVLELNNADTTSLKKIPGIGSTFAKRIINISDYIRRLCISQSTSGSIWNR